MSGKDQELSTRAVELACQFFENRGPDVAPGGMLEVAALIEGFLAGRFRVEYRSDFEPIKDGDDVFSLFSHVRAVVIDPAGEGEESEAQRIEKLVEENSKFSRELAKAKKVYNQIYDQLGDSQKREMDALGKLMLYRVTLRRFLWGTIALAGIVFLCVVALIWALCLK